ncbi:MAG: hypothetical protein IKY22_03925 [Bacteroidales bacterium]|nr:hypothetical protein [Bacteroidales bacterium]
MASDLTQPNIKAYSFTQPIIYPTQNHHTLPPKVSYFYTETAIVLFRNYGSFDG